MNRHTLSKRWYMLDGNELWILKWWQNNIPSSCEGHNEMENCNLTHMKQIKGWQHVDERNVLFGLEFITWMNLNMDASQLCESKWPFWGSWQHGWWRVSHENSTTWINVLMDKIDHVVGHMDEFYSSMKMNLYGWITSFKRNLSILSIHIDIIYP